MPAGDGECMDKRDLSPHLHERTRRAGIIRRLASNWAKRSQLPMTEGGHGEIR